MTETTDQTTIEDVVEGDVFVVDGYPDREETALADPARHHGKIEIPTRTDPGNHHGPYDLWMLPPGTKVEILHRGGGDGR